MFAGGAGINAEVLFLDGDIFLSPKGVQHFILYLQEFYIFLVALCMVFGKHTEIDEQQTKQQYHIEDGAADKNTDNAQRQQSVEHKF